jgi:hypothetical protein
MPVQIGIHILNCADTEAGILARHDAAEGYTPGS